MSELIRAFQIDAGFTEQLSERFADYARLVHQGLDKEDTELVGFYEPSAIQIKRFIEVGFWASMMREEGRIHDFTIALEPVTVDDMYSYVFDHAVPFEPETIAKLAPSINPEDCAIGVTAFENHDLGIWGFKEIPGLGMAIQTFGSGQILIHFGLGSPKAVVTGSSINFIDSARLDLPSTLFDKIANERLSITNVQRFIGSMFKSLDVRTVAQAMRSHGHGGTMLLVPSDSDWRDSISQPCAYSGEAYNRAKNDLRHLNEIRERDKPSLLSQSQSYDRAVEMAQKSLKAIAQLTAVDGAMVVDYDLAVLAFGAKIRAMNPDTKPEGVLMWEPFEGAAKRLVSLQEGYGTRHQSAAQFVFDQKKSVAIVASQDGHLSVLTWDSRRQTVVMVRQAEFALV